MATLSSQAVVLNATGLEPTYAAAASGGDQFLNTDGKTRMLHCINASGGALTVTVDSPTVCSFASTHDIALSVGAGETRIIGPFSAGRFNDSSGYVQITYSGVTSLTVGVLEI